MKVYFRKCNSLIKIIYGNGNLIKVIWFNCISKKVVEVLYYFKCSICHCENRLDIGLENFRKIDLLRMNKLNLFICCSCNEVLALEYNRNNNCMREKKYLDKVSNCSMCSYVQKCQNSFGVDFI